MCKLHTKGLSTHAWPRGGERAQIAKSVGGSWLLNSLSVGSVFVSVFLQIYQAKKLIIVHLQVLYCCPGGCGHLVLKFYIHNMMLPHPMSGAVYSPQDVSTFFVSWPAVPRWGVSLHW